MRTMYNPSRFLSHATRAKIKAENISLVEYVSNIESSLRSRGLHNLADTMLEEIDESQAEDDQYQAEQRALAEFGTAHPSVASQFLRRRAVCG